MPPGSIWPRSSPTSASIRRFSLSFMASTRSPRGASLRGEVDHLVRVLLAVEELDVVERVDLLERGRPVVLPWARSSARTRSGRRRPSGPRPRLRRSGTRPASLSFFGLPPCCDVRHGLQQEVAVQVREHVVVEQHALAHRVDARSGRVAEQARRSPCPAGPVTIALRFAASAPVSPTSVGAMSRCEVSARHVRRRLGRVRDDQRHVVLLAVGDRALGVQLVRTVHVAVVGGAGSRSCGRASPAASSSSSTVAMLRSTSRRQFR